MSAADADDPDGDVTVDEKLKQASCERGNDNKSNQ